MEIGDEELYLENVTLPWTADYQTEYDIHANERNPYYQYPSYTPSVTPRGIYSKEDDFVITTGFANFYTNNTSPGIGLSYSSPVSALHTDNYATLSNCCTDYGGSSRKSNEINAKEDNLKVFPNPNNGTELVLQFKFNNKNQNTSVEIVDMVGRVLCKKQFTEKNNNNYSEVRLNLKSISITDGFYIVRISNGEESKSEKLLVYNN